MAQCKAYKQRTDVYPKPYVDIVPVNCANCQHWGIDIERCRDETVALNMNDPELRVGWCRDW